MTSSKYTVKDSFAFPDEIVKKDSEFFMRSLDVGSPFTNILPEEIINIWTNTLFENTERVVSLSKIEFKEILSPATKKSNFVFNGKLYK